MLKSPGKQHPQAKTPPPTKPRKEPRHWSQRVQETVVSAGPEGLLNLVIKGGADNGQFCWLADVKHDRINYHTGKLHQDEILLEIQGQKVAGYTLRDVLDWLKQVSRNGAPVMFKTVKSDNDSDQDTYKFDLDGGQLPKDLRQYLNARFQKNSIDHDLQQTIRDNLYMRTVPCTTRSPRPGELNGVDYTFLSMDEFLALEKSGNLLESGLYDGNHYGTPKPPKDPVGPSPFRRTNSTGQLLPGQHPSSEGKRRRNRSNIETTSKAAASSSHTSLVDDVGNGSGGGARERKRSLERAQSASSLGPLPPNWEMSFTEDGTAYFIDHNNETTHWLDPRLSKVQKQSADECDNQGRSNQELPYGWEKVEDPHYGTYYIDHVNRKTQYENPVMAAKRAANKDLSGSGGSTPQMKHKHDHTGEMNGRKSPPLYENQKRFFTRNPAELKGQFLKTVLEKSTRGFGFTIVGGDDSDEEFLQIKNVVPGGPAFVDGQLQTGDVLVFVDATCVLGYTHQDVVNMFQGIQVGERITLEVCRGYVLPFDPNDPNTEIVTTVAVSQPASTSTNNTPSFSSSHNTSRSDMENLNNTQRSIKSMPDLSSSAVHDVHSASYSHRNKSFDELHNDSPHNGTTETFSPNLSSSSKPEILTIPITKGAMGFGFTIADSAYGQKVKQILDRERCLNLIEGDILVEINNTRVKDMVHAEVVKVLKDCPKGQASCIVVQRGGMLTPGRHRKNRNGRQSSEDGRRTPRLDSHSNVPRTPFYSPENSDAVSEGQSTVRSRTPTDDLDPRARTPSLRPKTPTSEVTGSDGHTRSKTPTHDLRGSGRLPLADMANRRDFGSYDDRHYHDHDAYGHTGYGRTHEAGEPRREYRSRTPGPDFMRGSNVQDEYMRQRPQEIRSKTPTHELHYGSGSGGGGGGGGGGGSSANHHNISGTPDFIPASRYLPPAVSPALNHQTGYGGYQQGSPARPNPQDSPYTRPNYDSPSPAAAGAAAAGGGSGRTSRPDLSQSQLSSSGKLNSSQTYSGALNYASGPNSQQNRSFDSYGSAFSGGAGTGTYHPDRLPHPHAHFPDGDVGGVARPRKQSTSFEHEEPAPTNLTRIPRAADRYPTDSPSSSLNRSRSPTRFGDDDRFVELTVFLKRQESGFGFRIIGGTEEGSQVSVGHIVPGGSADLDGRLRTGDEIIYVEGMSVIGCSHHKVVQLMGQSALNGRVSLGIRRRVAPSTDSPYRSQTLHETYPYDITVTRNENEGFGFVIISSVTRAGSTIGEYIGRIIENSPAERCNQLHVGDRILAVNGIDIMRMHHEDIVQIIKDSGYSVTLTIGPPQDGDASSTASTQRSSQGSMINAMAYPAQSESDVSRRFQPTPLAIANSGVKDVRPRNALSQPGSFDSDEEKFYAVELHRGSRGFGFSIRGGQEFNSMPLYVLRIADGGAADLDGRLRVGDQIIEINGYNTNNMTHAEAIDLIQNGGSTVRLLVKRTGKPPPQIGSPQPSAGLRPPPPPALSNGPVGQSSPSVPRRNLDPRDSYYYNNLVNHSRQHSAY